MQVRPLARQLASIHSSDHGVPKPALIVSDAVRSSAWRSRRKRLALLPESASERSCRIACIFNRATVGQEAGFKVHHRALQANNDCTRPEDGKKCFSYGPWRKSGARILLWRIEFSDLMKGNSRRQISDGAEESALLILSCAADFFVLLVLFVLNLNDKLNWCCPWRFPSQSPSKLETGCRRRSGGAAVPTCGSCRRPQPLRCHPPPATPAPPPRIALVVRNENMRFQPPMKQKRSLDGPIRGASPQPNVIPDIGPGANPAQACVLRRTTEPVVRLLRLSAPVSPLLSKVGTGACPARVPVSPLFHRADACRSTKCPRAFTLTWRGALGVAWQVQSGTFSGPHAARVAPRRAVAHPRGWQVAWRRQSVVHTNNSNQRLFCSARARTLLRDMYTWE